MTLIETIAGMAILGGLIAALVVARSRALHQLADADRRQRAVAVADAILSDWWAQPGSIQVGGSGVLNDGFHWRTYLIGSPASRRLGIRIVRLQVTDAVGDATTARSLAQVDFVLNPPPATEKER